MKKEEIRHDPVRDRIIQLIESIKKNKNSVLSSILIIILLIGGYGYFQNINLIKNSDSISISGLAQNSFINGNNDEAMVKFERLLKNSPKSDGAIQASIFFVALSRVFPHPRQRCGSENGRCESADRRNTLWDRQSHVLYCA